MEERKQRKIYAKIIEDKIKKGEVDIIDVKDNIFKAEVLSKEKDMVKNWTWIENRKFRYNKRY